MTKRINSRQKGKRVERAAVAFLKSIGFEDARRTQQYNGTEGDSDVVCPDSLPRVHIEVKGDGNVDLGSQGLRDAMVRANRDCREDAIPVVLWKRSRQTWALTFVGAGFGSDLDCLLLTVAGEADIRLALADIQKAVACP